MRRALLSTLLCLLLVGATAGGLAWLRATRPEPLRVPPRELGPVPVATRTLSAAPARQELRAFGTLRPRRVATLAAELAGRVAEVRAGWRTGAPVAAGELLVRLDTGLLDQEVRAAQAALEEARAALEAAEVEQAVSASTLAVARERLELARSEERRVEGLADAGDLSTSRLESARSSRALVELALEEARGREGAARAGLALARTRVAGAEAALALADERRARAELRAPFAGLLGEPPPALGSHVSPGVALATVSELGWMELDLAVAEAELDGLRPGLPARVVVDGRELEGRVHALGVRADPATRAVRVEVELANPRVDVEGPSDGAPDGPRYLLRAGQFAEATVLVRELDAALWIRPRELAWRDGRPTAFVAAPEGAGWRVEARELELGPMLRTAAGEGARELRAGLAAGERLIVSPLARLAGGEPCAPREDAP